jgi:hypothetical protein
MKNKHLHSNIVQLEENAERLNKDLPLHGTAEKKMSPDNTPPSTIDISQSIVWTHTRSIATQRQYILEETTENTDDNSEELQNVCLLFAKIAAEASLRCITITDYDTSEPLGRGMSFDVVGMNPPLGPWFRKDSVQVGPRFAIKRIRTGAIHNQTTALQLRPFLKAMIHELHILTHPPIRDHLNIISCRAVGYQNLAHDTSYLSPFIAVDYTNWTTLVCSLNS